MKSVREFLAVCYLCFCSVIVAGWSHGDGCTATPPAQAVALGLTKLVYCNTLFSNSVVDANNTLAPGYLLYMTAFGFTLPAADISNDGTGLTILTVPNSNQTGLTSTANFASSYAGNVIRGSAYVQIQAKFDDSNPASCQQAPNSWPAFWLDFPGGMTANGTTVQFTEADVFEWLNCQFEETVHDWIGSTDNCTNTGNVISFTPGTGFNTYGFLLQTSVDGGGTGSFLWYINDVLKKTFTYPPSGGSTSGTCTSSPFMMADTQPFNINLTAGTGKQVQFKMMAVFQKP